MRIYDTQLVDICFVEPIARFEYACVDITLRTALGKSQGHEVVGEASRQYYREPELKLKLELKAGTSG